MRPEHGDLTIHGVGAYEEVVDPDKYNEGADPDEIVRNAELIASRFPIMEQGVAMGGYSGVYDVTLDRQPVLGSIPEYGGLFADFGWSGHGFKHAPVIGDVLSDLVLQGHSGEYDLTPFRWSLIPRGRPSPACLVGGAAPRQAPVACAVVIALRIDTSSGLEAFEPLKQEQLSLAGPIGSSPTPPVQPRGREWPSSDGARTAWSP